MSYKGLIIKLQKVYAHYDLLRQQENIHESTMKQCDLICNEIDKILESELYMMKRHFKY